MNALKRVDPTRTTMIRQKFIAEIQRRFRKLRNAVWEFMVELDALGMQAKKPFVIMVQKREFQFLTDDRKLQAFNTWFKEQLDAGVFSLPDEGAGWRGPWTGKYVESAYRRGLMNAFDSSKQGELFEQGGIGDQGRDAFIRTAFQQPEKVSKVRLLGTRTFEQLKGVGAEMASQMNQILAQGMVDGKGAIAIANEMDEKIQGITKKRALMIARTEIINAHAEGQLDGFEELGVDELGVLAEWSTAGDERVCPRCAELEGQTFEIEEARGMIPLHPNCRCAWLPAFKAAKKKKKGKRKRR